MGKTYDLAAHAEPTAAARTARCYPPRSFVTYKLPAVIRRRGETIFFPPRLPPRRSSMADPNEEAELEQTKMSFGEHLEELRRALLKSILALIAGFLIGLCFGWNIVDYVQ